MNYLKGDKMNVKERIAEVIMEHFDCGTLTYQGEAHRIADQILSLLANTEVERLSEDAIDTMRLQTIADIGKVADRTWWDVCAAYEKMHGMDASMTAEQLLIDITNKTGLKVARAAEDRLIPIIEAQKAITKGLETQLRLANIDAVNEAARANDAEAEIERLKGEGRC